MSEQSQVTIVCYVDREDAAAFRSVANVYSSSRTNAYFAGTLLSLGLEEYLKTLDTKERDKLTPKARLALLAMQTKQRDDQQAMLNAIVSRGIVDERIADELHQIAEELDLDESEAEKFADESPFASAVAYSSNGTKMGRCQRWLASLFTSEQDRFPRGAVIGTGIKAGFHESMINRASRLLGIVKQKGAGGVWYWIAPEVNKDNSNNKDSYIE